MERYDTAILGAGGFAGQELYGILRNHPNVANVHTPNREELSEFEGSEVVFSALPHGESARQAARFKELGSVVIDLSGDLRFPTPTGYEQWYHQTHPAPELLPAPYVLPEHWEEDLSEAQVLSMPGCYPTATLLGLLPLIKKDLLDIDQPVINVDALSGVSGRGKKPTELTHFNTMSGNAISYKPGREHRHVGEIEQYLGGHAIFFAPTVIPIERGMLVKTTAQLDQGVTERMALRALEEAYRVEPFVDILPAGYIPDIHDTVRSDQCHIGIVADGHTVQITSSLDNLRKGAASQAVQAYNMRYGLEETAGLTPKTDWQAVTV